MHESKGKIRVRVCAVITVVSLVLALLLPFITVAVIAFAMPPVYRDTFVGELGDKYELLMSEKDKKIVIVGGSSVAFGIDSVMMEAHLGMSVVNFGLYANLGTKIMIDLTRSGINEGDIVILAPEMNEQTLSLYFNPDTAMQSLDGAFGMLSDIDGDNYTELLGSLWGFTSDKLGYLVSGEYPENSGAYSKEWFNERGDNMYDRPYNVMTTVSKSITLDFRVDDKDGVTTEYEEFIDYVNDYADYCAKRGATLYFSFPPMNEAALSDYNTDENIYAFYENLVGSLNCKVISNINDYIMDEGYFFDSEFHLNNSGVTVRTVNLIDDIKRELGISGITMAAEDIPEPSGYAPVEFVGGDGENLYFTVKNVTLPDGQSALSITGLNAEGKHQLSLHIPNNINGLPVIGIDGYAFAGSEVRTVVLGENITSIASCAFASAPHLSAVYVPESKTLQTDDARIAIPNNADDNGLATKGASDALKIYVPAEALTAYKSDYFWGDYSDRLVGY